MENTMIMGDMVLLESEFREVQKIFINNGIKISAIHNHLLLESLKIMYMYIYGNCDKIKLSRVIKSALENTSAILDTTQFIKQSVQPVDWSKVETILDYNGPSKGNILNISSKE